jgi:hypothetical protein
MGASKQVTLSGNGSPPKVFFTKYMQLIHHNRMASERDNQTTVEGARTELHAKNIPSTCGQLPSAIQFTPLNGRFIMTQQ